MYGPAGAFGLIGGSGVPATYAVASADRLTMAVLSGAHRESRRAAELASAAAFLITDGAPKMKKGPMRPVESHLRHASSILISARASRL